MSSNRILGIVLVVVGIFLAMWGYDVHDSAGAQVTRAIGGDTPMKAWLGMGGGVVCIVLGVLRLR